MNQVKQLCDQKTKKRAHCWPILPNHRYSRGSTLTCMVYTISAIYSVRMILNLRSNSSWPSKWPKIQKNIFLCDLWGKSDNFVIEPNIGGSKTLQSVVGKKREITDSKYDLSKLARKVSVNSGSLVLEAILSNTRNVVE